MPPTAPLVDWVGATLAVATGASELVVMAMTGDSVGTEKCVLVVAMMTVLLPRIEVMVVTWGCVKVTVLVRVAVLVMVVVERSAETMSGRAARTARMEVVNCILSDFGFWEIDSVLLPFFFSCSMQLMLSKLVL